MTGKMPGRHGNDASHAMKSPKRGEFACNYYDALLHLRKGGSGLPL